MVDVVINVGLYAPMQISDVQNMGNAAYTDLNVEDVAFLYTCRTRIPEVGHVVQFLYRYIFSGEMRVEPRGPVAEWVDFRTIGHRILEQLLVYGICFVSYDKSNEEPIVWDVADLNVQTRRTPQGHLEFRARVAPNLANGISQASVSLPVPIASSSSSKKNTDKQLREELDQPQFIVLVHKYPENGRLVSSLMALKPKLQLIHPSVFAAMVAMIRSANPVVYFTHTDSAKMSLAARQQWSQNDGAQIQQFMQNQATAEQMRMMHFFEQLNARNSMPAMSAMQLAYNTEDRNSAAVAWSVMEATTRSPIRPLPPNYDVAAGPTPSADLKFCEFIHEDVRMQVARAFGLPNSIFSPDERYMASSVAGLTRNLMENSMNHFSALVRASINYIYKYLVLDYLSDEERRKYGFEADPSKAPDTDADNEPKSSAKKALKRKLPGKDAHRGRYSAPTLPSATAETDIVTVEIMRRMEIEYIMLLKPELKRSTFIELLAETMGLSAEDFEEKDPDVAKQKELMAFKSTVMPPGKGGGGGIPSLGKKPKPNPLASLSTSATAKLK